MTTYTRVDSDTYAVQADGHRFTVRRSWYRVGGWQWEVPEVTTGGSATVKAPTRKAAVAAALRRLAA